MPNSNILFKIYSWRKRARSGFTIGLNAEGALGKPAKIEASAKVSCFTGLLK